MYIFSLIKSFTFELKILKCKSCLFCLHWIRCFNQTQLTNWGTTTVQTQAIAYQMEDVHHFINNPVKFLF